MLNVSFSVWIVSTLIFIIKIELYNKLAKIDNKLKFQDRIIKSDENEVNLS